MNNSQNQELHAVLKRFDPDTLVETVRELGEDWAKANSSASSLEETRKTLLAKLTREYMNNGLRSGAAGERAKSVSVSSAEQSALADERYEQHLDLMVQAREYSDITRVRYDMGKMRLELMRSQMATVRQEMSFSRFAT
ncbi:MULTISPECIES: hypothetical protein [unclassified Variovorax]|uniref:hypothetical protein n=1 Tax=unclassified Variovorax TaxID=663243 RepID=UPI00076BCAC4|nr:MULTISPECIES: hypothetical protein [unclassified Variovorax]KWT98340.1 hypothetical protein APY03_0475 [Variovorax sp. WDL1]PNG50000.1 hypothetical protein CHC06_05581 [Variovorax sp. B2]PNG50872.1 hypothetical protein CHC07_05486 [Variovorax sp. B4]VTU41610.1 hypothetical protein H6P1_00007 [Variovorax sp. PBL-H6]VTU44691.1 hypothetical protein SRS16P1_00896 [Variovorax sp. SRS16]